MAATIPGVSLAMNAALTTEGEQARAFYNDVAETLEALAERWQEESGYEDFKDYLLPIKPIAKRNSAKLVKMTKRPFGVIVAFPHTEWAVRVTSRSIVLKCTKITKTI